MLLEAFACPDKHLAVGAGHFDPLQKVIPYLQFFSPEIIFGVLEILIEVFDQL